MKTILAAMDDLSIDELRLLNRAVVDRINRLSAMKRAEFIVGDRVSFVTKTGLKYTGHVTVINRKNIRVKTDSGMVWNVSPALLKQVN